MLIRDIIAPQEKKLAETTSSSAIATAPAAGANAGSLFGGTFQQRDNPFRKKRKKK